MFKKTYEEQTENLLQGPRLKSEATIDFENITRAFLDPTKKVESRFNSLGELEVKIEGGRIYNLTQILANNPDFEHLQFTNDEINQYEHFIKDKNTKMKPSLKGGGIPSPGDYEKLDQEGFHHHLLYAEKLAITLYTGLSHKLINPFLRQHGQLNELKKLTPEQLNLRVKELILVSAITGQALAKIPERERHDEELYRHEQTEEIDLQRIKDLQENKVTMQKGLTSTTSGNAAKPLGDLKNKYDTREYKRDAKKTFITYTQPQSINPIGKKVKELSQWNIEEEVLFPPNTQFKYYDTKEEPDYPIRKFVGIPVRTLEGIDPYSYSAKESVLRSELLDVLQNLGSQASAKNLRQLKQIINAEIKDQAKMAVVFQRIDEVINAADNREFLDAARYVFNKHLAKPYEKTKEDNYPFDISLPTPDGEIQRPNHGLAHVMRVATYVPAVTAHFAQFANDPNLKNFCKELNAEEMKKIQIALLFSISGRESDAGFSNNPKAYERYKNKSAEYFRAYAKAKNWDQHDIDKFAEIIINLGNPHYEKTLNEDKNEYKALYNIMNLAHNLDLLRCYDPIKYMNAISSANTHLIINSNDAQKSTRQLIELANDMTIATGDRMQTSYENNQIYSSKKGYDEKLFVKASRNPEECSQLCNQSLKKMMPTLQKPAQELGHDKLNMTDLILHLQHAIKNGYPEIVKSIVNQPNFNKTELKDFHPLHFATENHQLEIMKILIASGFDINQLDKNGYTPLQIAIENNSKDLIKLLSENNTKLDQANNVDKTSAVKPEKPTLNLTALNMKENNFVSNSTEARPIVNENESPEKQFLNLITSNSDMNPRDADGSPLIWRAAEKGYQIAVKTLLQNGANPDFVKKKGEWNALTMAITYEHEKIVEDLLQAGANPNQQYTLYGINSSPLKMAIEHYNPNPDIVKMLLAYKADPNSILTGDSLLHVAIQKVKPEEDNTAMLNIIEILIQNGAHTQTVGKNGLTPLELAIKNQTWDAVMLLLMNTKDDKNISEKSLQKINKNINSIIDSVIDLINDKKSIAEKKLFYLKQITAGDNALSRILISAIANSNKNQTASPTLFAHTPQTELAKIITNHFPKFFDDKKTQPSQSETQPQKGQKFS